MYNKIEEVLGRTLNTLEIDKLNNLINDYSIDEIAECFKKYKDKHFNYVIEVLKNKPRKLKQEWLDREIINEPIDEETEKEFKEFQEWLVNYEKK